MPNIKVTFSIIKDTIDFAETFLFFTPLGGAGMIIGAFTSALSGIPTVSKVFYLLGFAIILIPMFLLAIVRISKKVKQQVENPESLVFPHICRVDARQLKYGKDYLTVTYSLPSALSYQLRFMTARCQLVIAHNNSTEEKQMKPVIVEKQKANEDYMEINLGEKISEQVRENLKNKVAMNFKLCITCWDAEGREHRFNTQDYETIALA